MAPDLPLHYKAVIRRLVRFAVVFLVAGMLVGILSTEYQKRFRYTSDYAGAPTALEDGKVAVPPGLMWETGFDLRISHGHFILIGGVIPLCVAGALFLVHTCGGRPVSGTLLSVAFWLYATGAAAALTLITYKGLYSVTSILAAREAAEFDLAAVHANMFGGSVLVRALSHAISHTVLAIGLGLYGFALFRSAGGIRTAPRPAG